MEEPAEKGLNLEDVEVVAGGGEAVGDGGIGAGVETDAEDHVEGGESLEAAVAVAQIEVVRIGLPGGVVAVQGAVEGLAVGHIERAEDEAIHEAEDDGVCADGEGEREDGGEEEAGRLGEDAEAVAKVVEEAFDEVAAESLVALFLVFDVAAELNAGAALGLAAGEAGALEVVGAVKDVGA